MTESAKKKLDKIIKTFSYVVIGIFVVLVGNLALLQIFQTSVFQTQAEGNRIRLLPVPAMRGDVVDRNGVKLATSTQVFNLYITYEGMKKEKEGLVEKVVEILGDPNITVESVREEIKKRSGRAFEPLLIKRKLSPQEMARLEERRNELPGITIQAGPIREYRSYPEGAPDPIAGHLLGYVREISAEELAQVKDGSYRPGDLIGKTGIEKAYEQYLRGRDGFQQVEVDRNGRPIRQLPVQPPVPGHRVVLTVDANLQRVMEENMASTLDYLQKNVNPKAKAGAAVLIDVKTGAILAMSSFPRLNPNDFTGVMPQEKADFYFRSTPPAAINRVLQVSYPPGSTFKMVTATAALESGKTNPQETINCNGRYWLPPYIRCWSVHGNVNLYSALAGSCNVYFQEMGNRAGIDMLSKVAKEYGLGQMTGINYPGEVSGLLPSREWKRQTETKLITQRRDYYLRQLEKEINDKLQQAQSEEERKKILAEQEQRRKRIEYEYNRDINWHPFWQPFDTFNLAIGQGQSKYTILQLANYVATIANGGTRYQPYLVDRVEDLDGAIVEKFEPQILNQVSFSPRTLAEVRKAMKAVAEGNGTAAWLFSDFPFSVAAKTGTAETGIAGDTGAKDYHGLFVAFAPYDDPKVAFAGIMEYGYHGGESIGKVARAVFEEYFGLKKTNSQALLQMRGWEE